MDFIHDQLAANRKRHGLTVIETYSHPSPSIGPRFRYRVDDVVQTLDRLCATIGYPKTI